MNLQNLQNNQLQSRNPLFYITAGLAALQCIFPFLHWIKVPVFGSLSSFFGGSSDFGSFSLFGYIFSMGNNGSNGFTTAVILVSSLTALASIVFNILYLIKGFQEKPNYYAAGRRGALMLLIATVIFLVCGGLSSLIFQIIKLTLIPCLALAAAIANRILIKKLRLAETGRV